MKTINHCKLDLSNYKGQNAIITNIKYHSVLILLLLFNCSHLQTKEIKEGAQKYSKEKPEIRNGWIVLNQVYNNPTDEEIEKSDYPINEEQNKATEENNEKNELPQELIDEQKLSETLQISNADIDSFNVEKEAIIIMGKSGAGKTTLVNLLLNRKLLAMNKILDDPDSPIVIKNDENNPRYEIGDGINAQTTIPSKIISQNTVYWDLPGLLDNRSPIQEIMNIYYIKKIFGVTNAGKILLVVSAEDLSGQANEFVQTIKHVCEMFVDIMPIRPQFSLLITKAEKDLKSYSDEIRRIADTRRGLTPTQKEFLKYLANNRNKALLARPETTGRINNSQYIGNILDILNGYNFINLGSINYSLSSDAKLELNKMAKDITRRAQDSFKEVNYIIKGTCRWKINSFNYNDVSACLRDIQTKLDGVDSSDINDIINTFNYIIEKYGAPYYMPLVNQIREFSNEFQFISTFDQKGLDFEPNLEKQLDVKPILNELLRAPQSRVINNTLEISASLINTESIATKIREHSNEDFKNINVFCHDTIYFNSDLIIPGKNLNIHAPQWIVQPNCRISLRGQDAENYQINAANGVGYLNDGTGQSGQDGLPGRAGKNGGNFFGQCKSHINLNLLSIDISGGNGGNGQRGGNGEEGEAGKEGDLQGIQQWNQEYILTSKQIAWGDRKGALEKAKHVCKALATFNDKFEIEYFTEGTLGARGGNAGRGGEAGRGGKRGSILLSGINRNDFCQIIENDGNNGHQGQHGTTGLGGARGRSYYGKYKTEKIFGSIRGISGMGGIPITCIGQVITTEALIAARLAASNVLNSVAENVTLEAIKEGARNAFISVLILVFKKSPEEIAKELTKEVAEATAAQALSTLSTSAVQEISKQGILEIGKKASEQGIFEIGKKASEQTIFTFSEQGTIEIGKQTIGTVLKETTQQTATELTKQAGTEIVKQTGVEATKQTGKSFLKSAFSLSSLGISLAVQGAFSVYSANSIDNNFWMDGPREWVVQDIIDDENNIIISRNPYTYEPTDWNCANQEQVDQVVPFLANHKINIGIKAFNLKHQVPNNIGKFFL